MQHINPQDLLQTIQFQAGYLGKSVESVAYALWNVLGPESRLEDSTIGIQQHIQSLTPEDVKKLSDVLQLPPPQNIQGLLMGLQILYAVSLGELTLGTSTSGDLYILSFELQESCTGRGSDILRYICYYADLHQIAIHLKAGGYPQTDHSRLIPRYLRHGFEYARQADQSRSLDTISPMKEIPLVRNHK